MRIQRGWHVALTYKHSVWMLEARGGLYLTYCYVLVLEGLNLESGGRMPVIWLHAVLLFASEGCVECILQLH